MSSVHQAELLPRLGLLDKPVLVAAANGHLDH